MSGCHAPWYHSDAIQVVVDEEEQDKRRWASWIERQRQAHIQVDAS